MISKAKKYSKDYWDGDRKFGYGGYFYKKGYWKKTALKIIKTYNLRKNSSILDIGCGKGYLLFEIKKDYTFNKNPWNRYFKICN